MADELQNAVGGALFFEMCTDSLPDAIDMLQQYGAGAGGASGFVCYALRLLGELDLPRLRELYERVEVSLRPVGAQRALFAASSSEPLRDAQDLLLLHQAESVVNRLARVYEVFGRADLSEEACSTWDLQAFQQVTHDVATAFREAEKPNPWACPGSVRCEPGGEWDLRTRILRALGSVRPVLRLSCDFSCDAAGGGVAFWFTAPDAAAMPHTYFDEDAGQWCATDSHERAQLAREHAYRTALVLAAAGFAGGLGVRSCSVCAHSVVEGRELFTVEFERRHFMAVYVPLARTLTKQSPFGLSGLRALAFARGETVVSDKAGDSRYVPLSEDRRPFPAELRALVRAGSVAELDVMTPLPGEDGAAGDGAVAAGDGAAARGGTAAGGGVAAGTAAGSAAAGGAGDVDSAAGPVPSTAAHSTDSAAAMRSALERFDELQPRIMMDPVAAAPGLEALVDELDAAQALAELEFELERGVTVQTQYCEHQIGRILLPLLEDDEAVLIRRAPAVHYYARRELAKLYLNTGAYARAVKEAQRLVDMAETSPEAHFLLINALVKFGRFEEVVEVCKHGLRVAYGRRATAYYLYRLAFAYWSLGESEVALACYTLVPAGEKKVSAAAKRERERLLGRLGRTCAPDRREAAGTVRAASVPIPLTDEAFAQLADAAVLFCDHGFLCLAQACVAYLHSVTHDDALGMLARSLGRDPAGAKVGSN